MLKNYNKMCCLEKTDLFFKKMQSVQCNLLKKKITFLTQKCRVHKVRQFSPWNISQYFSSVFKTPDSADLLKLTYVLQSHISVNLWENFRVSLYIWVYIFSNPCNLFVCNSFFTQVSWTALRSYKQRNVVF